MSDLIAIAYPDHAAAMRARANLAACVEKGPLDVEDIVVIAYDDDGRIYPVLGAWEVGAAALGGAVAGGLIGLVLLGPLLGIAAGAAVTGGVAWKRTFGDEVISPSFVNDLWENMTAGSAAMMILIREMTTEASLARLHDIHEPGAVIQTSFWP